MILKHYNYEDVKTSTQSCNILNIVILKIQKLKLNQNKNPGDYFDNFMRNSSFKRTETYEI